MKNKLLLLVILSLLSSAIYAQKDCECEPCVFREKNTKTSYPHKAIMDYSPRNVFARVAYPLEDDNSRLWIKGNNKFDRAIIFSSDNTLISKDTIFLSPPFYTETVSIYSESNEVVVHFYNQQNKIKTIRTNLFQESDFASLDNNYSIMFYGCFQPFKVDDHKQSTIINSDDSLNYHMREYFEKVSLGNSIEYKYWKRNDSKPKKFRDKGLFTSQLISEPKLVIGTGDQIYVDAGYKYTGNKNDTWEQIYRDHPISAWGYLCCDPTPLLSPENYKMHLDKTYNAFNSFSTLDTVFRTLPSINVWDDHEIRDGWGSHGDEYDSKGIITDDLKPYYDLSRTAFIDHQWNIGSDNTLEDDLSQIKSMNDLEIFAFDLRTFRNINDTTVLGVEQFNRFQDWCNTVRDNKTVIIVSSIPFFYGNTVWSEEQVLKLTECELLDDIKDSWGFNFNERNKILSELIKLRKRGVKPILVSGDVHVGAMTEIWYEPLNLNNTRTDNSKVLCYELIASGLSHESLGEGQASMIRMVRDKSENQRWNDPTIRLSTDSVQIYPTTRISKPDLNFGAIEMKSDSLYLHLYTTETRKKENFFVQNTLFMDWDKSIEEDKSLRYTSFKQVLFNIFNWKTKTYTPAPVETKKKIKLN